MKRLRLFLANIGHRGSYRLVSPPLGLLYIAAYVRSRMDVDILIVDQRAEDCSHESLIARAKAFAPDVIGITCFTSHAHLLDPLTRAFRAAAPDATIVLGGPHVSAVGRMVLEECPADIAVAGEGELPLEAVLQARRDGEGLEGVPGLIRRDRAGAIMVNPGETPTIANLDDLPFPAYDLIDARRYWKLWSQTPLPPPRKFLAMFTSRGCPYKCIYCHKVFGKRFRGHSAQRIVAEIEHYQRAFGIDEVEIFDDIFNFNKHRVLEFCEMVRQKDIRIKIAFPNSLRSDLLTEDVIDALHRAGMYISAFALETGSPRVQQYIGKRLNIDRYLQAVEWTARRRIFTYGFMMLGFPTETIEEVRQTLDTACRSHLHAALFYRVVPYPHTDLWRLMEKNHPEKIAAIQFADTDYTYRPTINCSDIPEETLAAEIRRGVTRFYGNPLRLLRIARDYPKRHCLPLYLPRVLFHLKPRRPGAQPIPGA